MAFSRLDNPCMRVQNSPHFLRQRRCATVTHAASRAKEVPMSAPAANPESPESSRQDPSRRRFLKSGAALGAALAAGAGLPLAGRAQPAPDDPSKVLGGPCGPTATARVL